MRAHRFLLVHLLILLATALASGVVAAEPAADRLFVLVAPDDVPGMGTIVAFDIGSDGVPVQAETYPTDGRGWARFSPQDVTIDAGGQLLFAANNDNSSIAVFAIEEDGTLRAVAGSPFGVGQQPVFLATNANASHLFAATEAGLLALDVGSDGALDPIQFVPAVTGGLVVSPDGNHLYVADLYGTVARAYRIASTGMLEELPGSPIAYDGASRPWRPVISGDGERVWVLDLDGGLVAFEVENDGGLLFTGRTPVGEFADVIELTGEDRYLYVGTPFAPQIGGYATAGDAPTELGGSPFPAQYTAKVLAATPEGSRLYQVTGELSDVTPFAIAEDGGLSSLSAPVVIDVDEQAIPNGAAYLARGPLEIGIDVRPGSERNLIQRRSHGLLPVAILGAEGFDVADVDPTSVRFGPGEAWPAHRSLHDLEDIDGDGDLDVVLHFRVGQSGFTCADTSASLVGQTFDGMEFRGSDTVEVLGCRVGEPTRGPASGYLQIQRQ